MRYLYRLVLLAGMGILIAWPLQVGAGEPQEQDAPRPNIVLIMADDLGWYELGCYGNKFNETPHLDGLARRGMRFTQAYAAAPVCSPHRAALLTGLWPTRVGITNYLSPDDENHLDPRYITIAEALKTEHYATGIVGKWHLSGYSNHGADEVGPAAQGFDEVMLSDEYSIGGGDYFHPYHFKPDLEARLPNEHLIDRCNLEAVEFIERHAKQPFFLYLSHYAVHRAIRGRADLVKHFESKPDA
ncbi:MAG: sulfatase-like hydrolase/transferase, partial [Planctomycetales bacterium]